MSRYLAELLGTALLVVFGCGSAITHGYGMGYLGIAFAFGLVIVALAYSIGNISGCHVNPAVSLAMWIRGNLDSKDFLGYVAAQSLGPPWEPWSWPSSSGPRWKRRNGFGPAATNAA